jgi:hypothetical protein
VLADLPDAKLWRINRGADYALLNRAARGQIDVEKIARHWPDILRVVCSIHTRAISAHDVIRMLQRLPDLGGAWRPLRDPDQRDPTSRTDRHGPRRLPLTAVMAGLTGHDRLLTAYGAARDPARLSHSGPAGGPSNSGRFGV